jgi:DNA-binding response OmpR family regulator
VLAIDDEPLIGDIVSAALARDGHVVRTRTTAEHALELLDTASFDVVLSDLGLGADERLGAGANRARALADAAVRIGDRWGVGDRPRYRARR